MRTRRKLTAAAALALAGSAIGGGALITSHAMADGGTPTKGTLTVVSMQDGPGSAFRCTYDDVDLPALPAVAAAAGTADPAGAATTVGDVTVGAVAPGPDGGGSVTIGGAVALQPGSAATVTAVTGEVGTETGATTPGDGSLPTLHTEGAPPPGGLPVLTLDSGSVRQGTPEECASLQPGTAPVPAPVP